MTQPRFSLNPFALALLAASAPAWVQAETLELADDVAEQAQAKVGETAEQALELQETRVIGTAEQELKQAPGVSIITAEDIRKRPPANDLSDVIRREPGVNLTGNSTSGNRGNNRQIDLRGMDSMEAVAATERFLDNAVMAKLEKVTIIHGKGTGALRAAVQQSLRRNKAVKSYRLGRYGEGESGVTVVELK